MATRYIEDEPPPRGVGIRLRWLLWLVLLLLVGVGVAAVLLKPYVKANQFQETVSAAVNQHLPPWMKRDVVYTVEEPVETNHAPPVRDLTEERLAALERKIDALAKRGPPQAQAPAVAPAKPPITATKRPPLLFLTREREETSMSGPDTHTLAAGTFIPCTLQTMLHSEIEGHFTVVTRRPVYDSETGRHLLIPQGRTIVAKDTTSALLLGNERIPTFALTMTLPGGRSVDLGQAPITDATGTNGLSGDISNHTWRLVWTTFVMGALRGGQQVLQTEATQAGAAGQMAAGIGSQSNQVAQQRLGRAQDTRPTLSVSAGETCHVLLTKALHLPAVSLASR